ncbi:hypothetical protein J3F81_004607, partial [Coemansia sp. RSA 371]
TIDKKIDGVLVRVNELTARTSSGPDRREESETMIKSLNDLQRVASQIQRNVERILVRNSSQTAVSPYYPDTASTVTLLDLQNKLQVAPNNTQSASSANMRSKNQMSDTQRIMFNHKIIEKRTSCSASFSMASAMQRANAEWANKQVEPPKKRPRASEQK